jgi:hypothetical protein
MEAMENENDSEGYGKNYVPHITYDGWINIYFKI